MSSLEKKKLSELLLIMLALTFVVLVGFERLVLMPREQAMAYEKAIEETRTRMSKAGPLAQRKRHGFEELQVALRKVTDHVLTLERSDRVADFIRETAIGEGVRVPQIGFEPGGSADDTYLVPVEVSLQIRGSYPQVARFIEKLEAGWLERTGLPMTLRSLVIGNSKAGGVDASLRTTLMLGKEIPWDLRHGTTPG